MTLAEISPEPRKTTLAGRQGLMDKLGRLFGRSPGRPVEPARPREPRPSLMPQPPAPDPDEHNPATIVKVGSATDGRTLVMTLGLGAFLLDAEAPTICYFRGGNVAQIPTRELQHTISCLMAKRSVQGFEQAYIDLMAVVGFEMLARSGHIRRTEGEGSKAPPKPKPIPKRPPIRSQRSRWPDAENPATIVRVGRLRAENDLVMTLGLGTFVLCEAPLRLRYFDRGREWDVPLKEQRFLKEALAVKDQQGEFQTIYEKLNDILTRLSEE
jgi:hypothetical protein